LSTRRREVALLGSRGGGGAAAKRQVPGELPSWGGGRGGEGRGVRARAQGMRSQVGKRTRLRQHAPAAAQPMPATSFSSIGVVYWDLTNSISTFPPLARRSNGAAGNPNGAGCRGGGSGAVVVSCSQHHPASKSHAHTQRTHCPRSRFVLAAHSAGQIQGEPNQ
jgi:hypothetical protein